MNESEPKKLGQNIRSYEDKVQKGYDELGNEGVGVENWGTMMTKDGEMFNGYSDPRAIETFFTEPIARFIEGKKESLTVADLGGDDGYLLNEILTGLRKKNHGLETKGIVVDLDSTGKARKSFSEKQSAGERADMELVVGDITQLPLGDGVLDVAISRMAMQYLDQEQQEKLLKEIVRVLKKEGYAIIQTVTDEKDNKAFNEVFEEITEIISKSPYFKRLFPSFKEFTSYKKFANKYGIEPMSVYGSVEILFPMSAKSFAKRFKVAEKDLEELYTEKSKKYPELFREIDGQQCLIARLLNLRFKKT